EAEGVEGKYYLWTRRQLVDALGPEDGALFARVYGIAESRDSAEQASAEITGGSVLFLAKPIAEIARDEKQEPVAFEAKIAALRAKLLAARDQRVRPARDDKVLAGWNGLMIGSLARA